MFWRTFNKLQLSRDLLRPYTGCLYGFVGDQVEVCGHLELRTTFTDGTTSRIENIRYLVVNAPSAYNILLGRPTLNRLRAVASTRHMKMKFPDLKRKVITIKSDQKEAKRCYENNLKTKRGVFMVTTRAPHSDEVAQPETSYAGIARGEQVQRAVPSITHREQSEERPTKAEITRAEIARERRPEPVDDVKDREIRGKVFKLGNALDQVVQDWIVEVIERHLDAFAWSASDMPGIYPDFLCHHLTMDPKVRPVRQRRRKFNDERCQVIREETQKLLNASHIREIQYPKWLANVVLVKKVNGKWRMCVDFTDLNKECPKDSYPLPSIDALVDSASGCKMLSFLDAFSGYNQIKMHPRDECKTAFMTELSCYCYKVMPFRLKKCRHHLPEANGQGARAHDRAKRTSLRG
ncbi:uncharacterized protein [Phaseolus vulgaris]|uniref:uncharacterized protein n=1 Tax=Phaseolus vulgaris TaxID=3885 RepID=UPI0035CC0317